jgi:hypothetical protein
MRPFADILSVLKKKGYKRIEQQKYHPIPSIIIKTLTTTNEMGGEGAL